MLHQLNGSAWRACLRSKQVHENFIPKYLYFLKGHDTLLDFS